MKLSKRELHAHLTAAMQRFHLDPEAKIMDLKEYEKKLVLIAEAFLLAPCVLLVSEPLAGVEDTEEKN